MDPVSQGVVGAAFAQTAARRGQLATVAWYGALGGMAPDLDVLFQSPTDPLLFLEFHRQFTHSLVFIPFGALAGVFGPSRHRSSGIPAAGAHHSPRDIWPV
jgi:inner membrane protein